MAGHRLYAMPYAALHRAYHAKAERKGRGADEVDAVVRWLTGYTQAELSAHCEASTTVEAFFGAAPMNPERSAITGTVCGVRVENVADPLMRDIRYLDKLIDELAKGRPLDRVLRKRPETPAATKRG